MITRMQLNALHEMGIQTDMFGRKLKKGDTVLTKGYSSPDKDTFAIVKKVNKKSIVVDVYRRTYSWGPHRPRPAGHQGAWNYYPNKVIREDTIEMRRFGMDTLLVSPDFYDAALSEGMKTIEDYPEAFI